MIEIYTDGAIFRNGKSGAVQGCAAVVRGSNGWLVSVLRSNIEATSNRAELLAVLLLLENLLVNIPAVVYTDSMYIVRGCLVNKHKYHNDLWDKLLRIMQVKDVQIKYVKGHAGAQLNEFVDRLAKLMVKQENFFGKITFFSKKFEDILPYILREVKKFQKFAPTPWVDVTDGVEYFTAQGDTGFRGVAGHR